MKKERSAATQSTRRDFLKRSATIAAGATVAPLAIRRAAHAAGSDVLKVGLIGCGGRGSGAAANAMNAGKDVRLVAMGDLFADKAQAGVFNQTADVILGTKGQAYMPSSCKIVVGGETVWQWDHRRAKPSMYDVEHQELFDSIRSGKPINNGLYMVRSTMLAILGRMVSYTGQKITWEEAMKSEEVLGPEQLSWDTEPPVKPGPDGIYPTPIPGFTKFS